MTDKPKYAAWVRVCSCGHEIDWHRSNSWDADLGWCSWNGCPCRTWDWASGGNFHGPERPPVAAK